jgi:hypothetical protein
MTDSAFVDDDDSVYKNHVLYVVLDDPNCVRLQRQLESHPLGDDVWVQDALAILPQNRPGWLTGVPILVSKAAKMMHKGNNIQTYLAQWGTGENEDGLDLIPASASGGSVGFDFSDGRTSGSAYAGLNEPGMFSSMEDDDGESSGAPPSAQRQGFDDGDSNNNNGGGGGGSARDRRLQKAYSESSSRAQEYSQQREEMDRNFSVRNSRMRSTVHTA